MSWYTAEGFGAWRREREMSDKVVVDVGASIDEYLDRTRLAGQRQRQPGVLAGRADPQHLGQGDRQLLAEPRLPGRTVGQAHREGDLHIHDLDMLSGYCAGWSLRTLLTEGLNGVPGKVDARPPRHFGSAIGQIVNFLGTMQNEWAGAQAFSSFDTYMAPYVRLDGLHVRAGPAGHPGAGLQPQRAVAVGHADAVHQPDVRLGLPGRPARAGAARRRRADATSPTATCRPRWT